MFALVLNLSGYRLLRKTSRKQISGFTETLMQCVTSLTLIQFLSMLTEV